MPSPYPLTITLSDLTIPSADAPTREVRVADGQTVLYLVSPSVLDQFAAQAKELTDRIAALEEQLIQLRKDHDVTRRQMRSLVPQATAAEEEEMRAFLQQKFVSFEEVLATIERLRLSDVGQ